MTKRIKLRSLIMGGIFTLLFVGLIVRVYWVQVVKADFWAEQAMNTWITSEKLPQERGMLLDRNGKVLAADAAAYTIAVGPKKLAEAEQKHPEWKLRERIVTKLNEVLGTKVSSLNDMVVSKKDNGDYRDQREVRPEGWKVDKEIKDQLSEFRDELRKLTGTKDVGLYFVEDSKRYYPSGSLASHILGYVSKEGDAVIGLEKMLDSELKGEPGFIKYQQDGARNQLPNGEIEYKQAVDGKIVTLTIDRDIQFYLDEALQKAYEAYNPASITAIAADPNTMEILGMSSFPNFDPNTYWETKNQASFHNNAVQSVYEPGSTFKIVTLAAAVEEGLFKPDDVYQSGSIVYYEKDRPIRDYNWVGWGQITYLEGLKHSSNVAFVKLGYQMLGKQKLVEYINAFGFGQKTGIELPNEISRSFSLNYPSEVATAALGQGKVLVTPIQQVAAVAAVANGGKLMQPHVVKSITDPNTGEITETEPKFIRQVISEATSRTVGDYLEQVVSDQLIGTGRRAYIPGYRIAGKTGTAQKVVQSENGGYSKDKYVVSFIGYAPVENPKIVLYVIIDEPQVENAGGGALVAPIFKEIMRKSLERLGIFPDLTEEEKVKAESMAKDSSSSTKEVEITATIPDVVGMNVSLAHTMIKQRMFPVGVLGTGDKVLQQLPKGGTAMPPSQRVYLLTDAKPGSVPDLRGLSLRDAIEMCTLLQAEFKITGTGYVIDQKAVKNGEKWSISLTLSPPGESTFSGELYSENTDDPTTEDGTIDDSQPAE
ncbi:MAG: penicillin-binding transpeptidase domain-containing protein [Candidatus Cohnella colombiensis]|uniref:Penicillin-binding transpeptidase domain-containing protein n=1 Tax=Candidatus Cohnella colombiensis TaxID=3121368 RepID=A0AA95JE89_9BACL|nr:MAG: penicillin-binding transpeptidase domain-containing protein [Cohnella sp.]